MASSLRRGTDPHYAASIPFVHAVRHHPGVIRTGDRYPSDVGSKTYHPMLNPLQLARRFRLQVESLLVSSSAGRAAWQQPGVLVQGPPLVSSDVDTTMRGLDALLLWEQRPNQRFVAWRPIEGEPERRSIVLDPVPGTKRYRCVEVVPTRHVHIAPSWSQRAPVEDMILLLVGQLAVPSLPSFEGAADDVIAVAMALVGAGLHRLADPGSSIRAPTEDAFLRIVRLATVVADQALVAMSPRGELPGVSTIELAAQYLPDPAADRLRAQWSDASGTPIPGPTAWWHEAQIGQRAIEASRRCSDLGLPMTNDPRIDWSTVGGWACRALRRMERKPWPTTTPRQVSNAWARVEAQHRRASWPHQWTHLRLSDLGRDHRWDWELLKSLVYAEHVRHSIPPERDPCLDVIPLDWGMMALGPGPINFDESIWSTSLCDLLGVEGQGTPADWAIVRQRTGQELYQRRPMPKRSGGLRWLDVPGEPLVFLQRALARLLTGLMPRNGMCMGFMPYRGPVPHALAHAGAIAAVSVDVRDFFGSVRPFHLARWFGNDMGAGPVEMPLATWSAEGRSCVRELLFRRRGPYPYLPQGAPSSPMAANLAATRLDFDVFASAKGRWTIDGFTYTRYADDLVLSTRHPAHAESLICDGVDLLEEHLRTQGWSARPQKTRAWQAGASPLVVTGLVVPGQRGEPARATRAQRRRAKAARHRLRGSPRPQEEHQARGTLALMYSVTGDPAWLAHTSKSLRDFALALAGPVFAHSVLAGWSDVLDAHPLTPPTEEASVSKHLEPGVSPDTA